MENGQSTTTTTTTTKLGLPPLTPNQQEALQKVSGPVGGRGGIAPPGRAALGAAGVSVSVHVRSPRRGREWRSASSS